MKKVFSTLAILAFGLLIITSCSTDKKYASTKLKTYHDTISYFLGLTYGSGIKQANIDSLVNYNAFMKGVKDAIKNDTLPVSQQQIQMTMSKFVNDLQNEQIKKDYKDYMEENKAFLAENSKKDSVVTLPSGLQYMIIKEGKGNKPTMNDTIKVHYTGKLIDGTVFDSSYDRKEPTKFVVGEVIPGWVEALQLMPVGSKWRIFIPEDLAYGIRGQRNIKPFSTLIFDVELLEIIPPAKGTK